MENRFFSFEQNVAKYVNLSEDELIKLGSFYSLRMVKKNENILLEGNVCIYEGYVLEGCFKVYYEDKNLKEHILYFAVEDWWVLDVESFVLGIPSRMNIQALEDSVLLVIEKEQKEKLYEELPKVEKLFRIMNQQALGSMHRRMISMLEKSAYQRYLDFSAKYPTLTQRIPQYQIASYLGITQEFLSKIRKKIL